MTNTLVQRLLAWVCAVTLVLSSPVLAQVVQQPFEQGDILPFIDVGHKTSRHYGNWSQNEKALTIRAGANYEPLNDRWLVLPFDSDGSPYTLEIEVERLAPGALSFEFPIGAAKVPDFVECVFDENGRYSGPRAYDELPPGSQVDKLKKKSPSREFKNGLIQQGRKVLLSCEVSSTRIKAKVGTISAFDFDVDLGRLKVPGRELKSWPRGELLLISHGEFRFTRISVKGKGTINSPGAPGTITAVVPDAPREAKPVVMTPPPRPLAPPICELAIGTWVIKPLTNHDRYPKATLHIVSSEKGDVRGALQWTDNEGQWAFELLRGQIVGNQLKLAGNELQSMGFLITLGRYSGEVSPDGKTFRNVSTIIDGRRIREASQVEHWEAEWLSPDLRLKPRTRAAYDDCFRNRRDEDTVLWQFTDQAYLVDSKAELVLHGRRADRQQLAQLAKSANPRVAAIALAMMQEENVQDARNGIANVSRAVNLIEQDVLAYRESLDQADRQRVQDTNRAVEIADERERNRALAAINSQHMANTMNAFGAMFDTSGARTLQLNDIDRLRLAIRGLDCREIQNQQVRSLLKERGMPEKPQSKTWGVKVEAGHDRTTLIVTHTGQTDLHHCFFLTEFQTDPKKTKSDWDKQQRMMPYMNGLFALTMGVSGDVLDRGAIDTELTLELLSHGTGYGVMLPVWKPGQKVTLHVCSTAAAKYAKSASLLVATDETGTQETRLTLSQFLDAMKRLPAGTPNSLRPK